MVTADLVIASLEATSKKHAFELLAEQMAQFFNDDVDAVFNALVERERIGTTGIGAGVAIPHIKLSGLRKTYGVLARLNQTVDYEAIDGHPVDIIFMLMAPAESKTTLHLKALTSVARFLKDIETCQQIRATKDPSRIIAIFNAWNSEQAA